MTVGERIAALRCQADMTQEELAERLFVSRQLVSMWETGSRKPGRRCVDALAELFSVSPDDIDAPDGFILRELAECVPEGGAGDAAGLPAALDGFLATLGERERRIFIRRYYFSEDYAVISEKTGIRENNARAVTARTRKKLKKYLKEATPS